jgi:tryptophan-rich sensory protein
MKQPATIANWVPLTMATCSLVSIIALFRLDSVVHQSLYAYGLQFSYDWATPYWNAIRLAFGMAWAIIIVAIVFQVYMVSHRNEGKTGSEEYLRTEKSWNTYKLGDGATIKVKTVVNGVRRLNEYSEDGKPVYSIKADNIVEVVDVPEKLMKPQTHEN